MPRVPSPREKIWAKGNNPLGWIEGHVEGVTSWAIGNRYDPGIDLTGEANSLFHTQRMVLQYFRNPYPALNRSRLE